MKHSRRETIHICNTVPDGEGYTPEEQQAMYPHWCSSCFINFVSRDALLRHRQKEHGAGHGRYF